MYYLITDETKCFDSFLEIKAQFLKKSSARLIFDPFLAPRTTPTVTILLNFVEAIANLFLKLQTSNVIKLDNLGVILKKIEARI